MGSWEVKEELRARECYRDACAVVEYLQMGNESLK